MTKLQNYLVKLDTNNDYLREKTLKLRKTEMANTMFALGIYTYDEDEVENKLKKQPENKFSCRDAGFQQKAEGQKLLCNSKIKRKESSFNSNRENLLNLG